jgi:glycosyltransferase involved in cell wall biosynthesis
VAPETFDLRDYDLILSSSGAWSKGIITRLNTIHIAYLHSPMRFVWDNNEEYLAQQKKSFILNFFIRKILNYIRIWDKVAADRPDYIISNSKYTQERVKKYYEKESVVIYPPAYAEASSIANAIADKSAGKPATQESGIRNYESGKRGEYFLVVSRLSPYKKIDVVVEAFNKLKLPLKIVGEGEQKKYLEKKAGSNVKILGWQSDENLRKIYAGARAFIFAGVDDFGIAPVEAMSWGLPVLAIRCGGVKETVIEGQTGEFFDEARPESIIGGVRKFEENEGRYDREFIMARAGEFNKERFVRELEEYISETI